MSDIFWDGRLQIGDFNQAILLRRNATAPDEACTFRAIVNDGVTRSPEEYRHANLTRAVDVWSFGSVLYHLLTGIRAWSRAGMKKDAVQAAILAGGLPDLGSDLRRGGGDTPVDALLLEALAMCQAYNVTDRATARDVAGFLADAVGTDLSVAREKSPLREASERRRVRIRSKHRMREHLKRKKKKHKKKGRDKRHGVKFKEAEPFPSTKGSNDS